MGWLFSRLGQSQVVSEMIAGVALGPSLLGWLWPAGSAWLFPAESKPILFAVAQLGLVLYMFLIGCELDLETLRAKMGAAASVSLAGILAPFALGTGLAIYLHELPGFFASSMSTAQAMLFMGAAMSITAFPMLARIIHEQGLSKTALGSLALTAGALDDAAAWCVLAVVLASFQQNIMIAVVALAGSVAYALLCWFGIAPLMKRWSRSMEQTGQLSTSALATVLMLVVMGAWFTDTIQIYAVFGAFLMGVAMPRGVLTQSLHAQIYPLTTAFLLPVFFIYSGLNTQIGLLNSPGMWLIAVAVLLCAVLGKGAACYAAARWHGFGQREALGVGALMNARGLMELIILNIGLQSGIIQAPLFAIMVLMAVVTTLMATPIFSWLYPRDQRAAPPLL